jgi:pyruvate dehydrogenase kinase 2/3/4
MDTNTAFQLDRYSRYIPAAISIKHLLDHGKTANQLGSFLFLKKEIPTRLANMIKELQLLPSDLKKQKECTQILNDYISSFREVLDFKEEKGGADQLNNFTQILNNIRRRHLDTVPKMATAVFKMQTVNTSEGVSDTVQYFLDRLYINRISIHMLISQHNALLGEEKTLTGMVGTIDQKCDILAVCEDAYQAAAVLCDREYLDHPKLKWFAKDTTDENMETQGNVSTSYVPAHLHHIMFEIFKNSMRATLEVSQMKAENEISPIEVRIYKTRNDITIKISDLGGGISRASSGKIFNYMYSTAPQVIIPEGGGSYGAGLSAETLPMHGLGYGLPLSRLYARYFRGDIKIASVDGYGTDVYVYLQRLSHLAQENLPVYNAVSSAKLRNSATQVNDWTDLGNMQ